MSTEKQMSKTVTKITLDWLNHKLMLSSPSVMNLNKKINWRKEKEDKKMSRIQRHVWKKAAH